MGRWSSFGGNFQLLKSSQMPQEEKAKQADVVINTDCPMDELKAKVAELWHSLP